MDVRLIGARALPFALAATLAAPFVLRPELNPATVILVSSLGVALLLVVAAFAAAATQRTTDQARTAVGRPALLAVLSAVALAVWLSLRTLGAVVPQVSFVGTVSQHSGAALFVLAAGWLAAAVLLADRQALRLLTPLVALSGAAYGALGLFEALTTGERAWGSAAGPFDNSSSLGSYLAVTFIVSLSWFFSTKTSWVRLAAGASAALSLAGIVASSSRTGGVGAVGGMLTAVLLYAAAGSLTGRRFAAVFVPLAGMGATAALVAGSAGILGDAVRWLLVPLSTDRDAIWRSALARAGESWLIGSGPEQFSAWVVWRFNGGALSFNGTYDPHSTLLALLLGGGIIGLVLWFVFTASTLWALLGVLAASGRSCSIALQAALPATMMVIGMFAWHTPIAVIVVAVLTGSLLALHPPERTQHDPTATRWLLVGVTVALAVGCLAIAGLSVAALGPERAFFSQGSTPQTPEHYAQLYRSWPDPAYASRAVDLVLSRSGGTTEAEALLGDLDNPALHHVDLSLRRVFLAQRDLRGSSVGWPAFEAAVERAALSDPASGLWFTLAAAQADALGLAEESARYAQRALQFELNTEDRTYLEGLLEQ